MRHQRESSQNFRGPFWMLPRHDVQQHYDIMDRRYVTRWLDEMKFLVLRVDEQWSKHQCSSCRTALCHCCTRATTVNVQKMLTKSVVFTCETIIVLAEWFLGSMVLKPKVKTIYFKMMETINARRNPVYAWHRPLGIWKQHLRALVTIHRLDNLGNHTLACVFCWLACGSRCYVLHVGQTPSMYKEFCCDTHRFFDTQHGIQQSNCANKFLLQTGMRFLLPGLITDLHDICYICQCWFSLPHHLIAPLPILFLPASRPGACVPMGVIPLHQNINKRKWFVKHKKDLHDICTTIISLKQKLSSRKATINQCGLWNVSLHKSRRNDLSTKTSCSCGNFCPC